MGKVAAFPLRYCSMFPLHPPAHIQPLEGKWGAGAVAPAGAQGVLAKIVSHPFPPKDGGAIPLPEMQEEVMRMYNLLLTDMQQEAK